MFSSTPLVFWAVHAVISLFCCICGGVYVRPRQTHFLMQHMPASIILHVLRIGMFTPCLRCVVTQFSRLFPCLVAGGTAQQQDPAGPVPNDPSTPRALTISCNGNYGVYLVARHAVQCLCQGCRMSRATEPQSECWLVSPTEFERHSGMPSAKKWRSR